MDRELALSMIIDFFIRPRIYQKNFEITQNISKRDRYELDIKIMNELREYLEKNLN